MERWFVYILESDNGRKYIGLSGDPDARLNQYNSGKSFWAKRYKNWKRIYLKEFNNYTEARRWEMRLKKQKGGDGLKKIIEEHRKGGRGGA